MKAIVTTKLDFDGLSIQTYPSHVHGSFHRMTPEQFDALYAAFGGEDEIRTLTVKPDNYIRTPRTFRTVDIDFGGLKLSLFSDVEDK